MSHGSLPLTTGFALDFGPDFDFEDLLIETDTKDNTGSGEQSAELSGRDSSGDSLETLCLENPLYSQGQNQETASKLEEWQLVPDDVIWYWDLDNTETQHEPVFFHEIAKELNFCREKLDDIKDSYESDRKPKCSSTEIPSENNSPISWYSQGLFSLDCDFYDLPGFSQQNELDQYQSNTAKQNDVPDRDLSNTSFPAISPIAGNFSSFDDKTTLTNQFENKFNDEADALPLISPRDSLAFCTGQANENMFFSLIQDFSLDSPSWDCLETPNTLCDKQNEPIDRQPQTVQFVAGLISEESDQTQHQGTSTISHDISEDLKITDITPPELDNKPQREHPNRLYFDEASQSDKDSNNKLNEKNYVSTIEKNPVDELHLSSTSNTGETATSHEVQSDKNHGEGDIMRQKKWWSSEIDKKDISFLKVPCVSANGLVFHGNQNGAIKVGEGSFGTVFLADLYVGRAVYQVVVKDFSPKGVTKPAEIFEEARILMHLSDTMFIPYFYGLLPVATPQQYAIVQEYFARGTSLHNILEDRSLRLSPVSWIGLCVQLAVGLDRFHRKGILMNDIKKDNILVDCRNEDCVLKYIDMGLASYKTGRVFYGSEEYMQQFGHLAPEVRRLEKTSPASDVYSIGKILTSIAKYAPLRQIRDLVSPCLSHSPSNRPHLHEIICQLLAIKDHIYNSCPSVLPRQNPSRRWFC